MKVQVEAFLLPSRTFIENPTFLKIRAIFHSFAKPFKINTLKNKLAMFRNIFFLIFCFCAVTSAIAQNFYLKMDNACMNRFEYSVSGANSNYVSYSFRLGDKKFASFDIGVEPTNWVQKLPGKLVNCSAMTIDQNFVSSVNKGNTKLFIVRENDNGYNIAAVEKGTYVETKNNNLLVSSEDVDFSLLVTNPISNVNLAMPGSKNHVYLGGTISYQCLRGFIFQKKEEADSRTYKEYVVIPEIGIVERALVAKTGFVKDEVRQNELRLSKVDNQDFSTALSMVCDNAQANYYDGATATTSSIPKSYDKTTPKGGTTTPKSYGTDPCTPTSEPGVHIVQKGETAYAISRKYGITVAQLQGWNKLTDQNVISVCQRLFVKEPGSVAKETTTTTTTTNSGAGSTTTTTSSSSSTGYWTQTSGEHQVRSGETVASLAKMYGYTEERFRKMNGLSATETVLPGQRLRTSDCNCPTLSSTTVDSPMPYDQASETILTNKDASAPVNKDDVYYRPISVYEVQSSDTFFSIAKQYNTTVERIWELNGLTKDDKLSAGMRIYVQ